MHGTPIIFIGQYRLGIFSINDINHQAERCNDLQIGQHAATIILGKIGRNAAGFEA